MISDCVITTIGSSVSAGQINYLTSSHILIGKLPRCTHSDCISRNPTTRSSYIHSGIQGTVVDFIAGGDSTDCNRFCSYVCRRTSLISDCVITPIGPTVRAGQINYLSSSHILVCKLPRCTDGHRISSNPTTRSGYINSGIKGTVVDFVTGSNPTDCNRFCSYVSRGARLISDCIITPIGSSVSAG